MKNPTIIIHADWSVGHQKRWAVQAVSVGSGDYCINKIFSISHGNEFISRLSQSLQEEDWALVGFDFPIGLPEFYAERAGISSFLEFLEVFYAEEWSDFPKVANDPTEISIHRPFFPDKSRKVTQKNLVSGLGAEHINQLRRRCDLGTPYRQPAAPLFWTMGAQQVGKAALSGWQEIILPNFHTSARNVYLWPFEGRLEEISARGRIILCETYPAEFYRHLNVAFPRKSRGVKSGKRVVKDRQINAQAFLSTAKTHNIRIADKIQEEITQGFGSLPSAEDKFDALVGVIGMILVIHDAIPEPENLPDKTREIEGWIFGQAFPY